MKQGKMLMYSCMGTYQHNVTSKKDKVHVLMRRSRSRPRPVSMSRTQSIRSHQQYQRINSA